MNILTSRVQDIGHTSWDDEAVWSNLLALVNSVKGVKPPKMDLVKYLEAVAVSAPFTPAVRLPLKPFRNQQAVSASTDTNIKV